MKDLFEWRLMLLQGITLKLSKLLFRRKTYGSALSDVVRDTGVSFAILHGTISTIKDVPYGQMIVRFEGPAEAIAVTISRLIAQGLDVEVIS